MCWDIGRFGYLFNKSRKKTLSFLCAPEVFGAATEATAASVRIWCSQCSHSITSGKGHTFEMVQPVKPVRPLPPP